MCHMIQTDAAMNPGVWNDSVAYITRGEPGENCTVRFAHSYFEIALFSILCQTKLCIFSL